MVTLVYEDGFNPYAAGSSKSTAKPLTTKLDCPKCGMDHLRDGKRTCHAHKSRTDPPQPCRNYPAQGLGVCRFHGGKSPQAIRVGRQRTVRDAIEAPLIAAVAEYIAANPAPSMLLPEPKPKKGGHKNPNSRSARRARLRRQVGRRDEQLPPWKDDPDGLVGRDPRTPPRPRRSS